MTWDGDVRPAGILFVLLVTAVWIGVVVLWRVPNPFATLVLVGGAYALFTMIAIIVVTGDFVALAPGEVAGILAFDLVWGSVSGAIAAGICRARS